MFDEIKKDCKYIRYYDGDTVGHCFGQKNAPRCDFELCADRKCGFKCSGHYVIEETEIKQDITDVEKCVPKINISMPNVNKWINVEDRLPKEWEPVIAWSEWGFHIVAVYIGIIGKWRECWSHMMLEENSITHWQPLPEPPKGE